MITKLVEFINSVLKGTCYLPITMIIKETCNKVAILFAKRRMEAHAMIISSQVFGKLVNKSLTNVVAKFVTHHVDHTIAKIKLSL